MKENPSETRVEKTLCTTVIAAEILPTLQGPPLGKNKKKSSGCGGRVLPLKMVQRVDISLEGVIFQL